MLHPITDFFHSIPGILNVCPRLPAGLLRFLLDVVLIRWSFFPRSYLLLSLGLIPPCMLGSVRLCLSIRHVCKEKLLHALGLQNVVLCLGKLLRRFERYCLGILPLFLKFLITKAATKVLPAVLASWVLEEHVLA